MHILFDHGAPTRIAGALVGQAVTQAIDPGRDRISNGELIKLAEEAGFDPRFAMDYEAEPISEHGLHHLRSLRRACASGEVSVDVPARRLQPAWTADELVAVQMPCAHNQFEQDSVREFHPVSIRSYGRVRWSRQV